MFRRHTLIIIIMIMAMITGEEKAWEVLGALDPADVCKRSLAGFDRQAGAYTVSVFGMPVTVSLSSHAIDGADANAGRIVTKTAFFLRLSILHYLVSARDIPPAAELIAPTELKSGGGLYAAGSHVLPLDRLATEYARDTQAFLQQGMRFGGERRDHGDASVALYPFPRLPVTLILWLGDDEFPARSRLLFDTSCERQLAPDVLWAVAMLCVKVMLIKEL